MDTICFFIYCIVYIGLFGWGIFLAKHHGWLTNANVILFVLAALFYDNLIVAIGRYIGEGNLLENLNYLRFWLHALFTPLLVVFALGTLKRAKIHWVRKKWARLWAYFIVVGLMILEIVTEVWGLKLEAKWEYGVLGYASVEKQQGPPWMVISVSVILLLASFLIWWKQKWPWMILGVVLMVLGSFLMSQFERSAIMNGFELILMISLLATKHFQDNQFNNKQ